MPDLRILNLRKNAISDCGQLFNGCLDALEILWLSSNKLTQLPRLSLMGLRRLSVSRNALKNVDSLADSLLPRL